MICARGQAALEETRQALANDTGTDVTAVVAGVGKPAGIDAVLRAAADAYGRVDILVTNSGGPPAGPFESHDQAAWDLAIRQNFESVVRLTRGVLKGMKERRWGRIINITSIAVKQPVDT